jgi:hypothetical protein
MLQASCHCGAIAIEIAAPLESVTECNCSICHRYGARWAYFTASTTRISASAEDLSAYSWGDRSISFICCARCGCLTHYESNDKSNDYRIAVNARMLPPAELAGVKVRLFDGADSWRYLHE